MAYTVTGTKKAAVLRRRQVKENRVWAEKSGPVEKRQATQEEIDAWYARRGGKY